MDNIKKNIILIVPRCEKGKGGGHLCRCINLVCDLRSLEREAFLFMPSYQYPLNIDKAKTEALFASMGFNPKWHITETNLPKIKANLQLIVLDNFKTQADELSNWKKIAPIIGIDEGGPFKDSFDFLIDILIPKKITSVKANIYNPSLLKLPKRSLIQKKTENTNLKILISFGQEDPFRFGLSVAKILAKDGIDVTLLKGQLTENREQRTENREQLTEKITILQSIPDLARHLGEYDLVITHYGITAYEALYASTAVLLINPTKTHENSAKAAGFLTTSLKNFHTETQKHRGIENKISLLKKHCKELAVKLELDKEPLSLAALINNFSPIINRTCPVCGTESSLNSICRLQDRTYRKCKKCAIIYMDRTCPAPIEYEKEYFFEKYKQQYGVTYIEDFPNLIAMAKRRLKVINRMGNGKWGTDKTLLDIGCAYGAFLAAAREEGFTPYGIDPAKDAVDYVQQKLNIPATQGFYPINCSLLSVNYNIITLWYVIEHFTDCVSVFTEIKKQLMPGGILAFSTPSFSGISGKTNLKKFLKNSPADHFTIWSPSVCKKALSIVGFKVKKIIVLGHHPERFPILGKFAHNKKSPIYWLLLAISKLFKLGDTFEVYAMNREQPYSIFLS